MEEQASRSEEMRAQAAASAQRDMAQLAADTQNVAQLQIDPDRFWNSRGTAAHVMGALVMGMEAFARSLNPNAPMLGTQLITDAIDRDLRAQAANITFAREGIRTRAGLLETQMNIYDNLQDAMEASRVIMLESARQRLATIAQQTRAANGDAWVAQTMGALQAEQATSNAAFLGGRETYHFRTQLQTPAAGAVAAIEGASAMARPDGRTPGMPLAEPPVAAPQPPAEAPARARRGARRGVQLAPPEAPLGPPADAPAQRPTGMPVYSSGDTDRMAAIRGAGVQTLPSGWTINRRAQVDMEPAERTALSANLVAFTGAINTLRAYEARLRATYGDDSALAAVWRAETDQYRAGHGSMYLAIGNISRLMQFMAPQQAELEIIENKIFPQEGGLLTPQSMANMRNYRANLAVTIDEFSTRIRDYGALYGVVVTPRGPTQAANANAVRGTGE